MSKAKAQSGTSEAIVAFYPSALCRLQHSKYDNSVFRSISFRFKDFWASFVLPEDDVSQSTKRNGEPIPDRFTLNLGEEDDIRSVSIMTGKDTFERKIFRNKTIKSVIEGSRKEYLRSIAL